MYSLAPLVDQSSSHIGLYFAIIASILIGALLFTLWAMNGNTYRTDQIALGVIITICVCLDIYVGVESFADAPPANTSVSCTFVGYHSGIGRSGQIYPIFNVDGVNVILEGPAGIAYPNTTILYKN